MVNSFGKRKQIYKCEIPNAKLPRSPQVSKGLVKVTHLFTLILSLQNYIFNSTEELVLLHSGLRDCLWFESRLFHFLSSFS